MEAAICADSLRKKKRQRQQDNIGKLLLRRKCSALTTRDSHLPLVCDVLNRLTDTFSCRTFSKELSTSFSGAAVLIGAEESNDTLSPVVLLVWFCPSMVDPLSEEPLSPLDFFEAAVSGVSSG